MRRPHRPGGTVRVATLPWKRPVLRRSGSSVLRRPPIFWLNGVDFRVAVNWKTGWRRSALSMTRRRVDRKPVKTIRPGRRLRRRRPEVNRMATPLMEHRSGDRRPLDCAATVIGSNGRVTRGVVRDISLGGIFVEMGVAGRRRFDRVDVRFDFCAPGERRIYRVTAMVVRKTPHGLGLMFDRFRPGLLDTLVSECSAPEPVRGIQSPRHRPARAHAAQYSRQGGRHDPKGMRGHCRAAVGSDDRGARGMH